MFGGEPRGGGRTRGPDSLSPLSPLAVAVQAACAWLRR